MHAVFPIRALVFLVVAGIAALTFVTLPRGLSLVGRVRVAAAMTVTAVATAWALAAGTG
jgi:hypothetical protein